MDQEIIKQIFLKHHLDLKKVEKINIGFTNQVYSTDDKYILKIYDDLDNLKREVYFYNLFKNQLPVPKIIASQDNYLIYHKIKGDNLYSKWHLLNTDQRKNIIKQLCSFLKIINQSPYQEVEINWHDYILKKINQHLSKIKAKELIEPITKFVNQHHQVLAEQKLGLVYWDAHFDNILIKDDKIIGLLDFERTSLASIDYNLDIIKRMQEYPTKYMSEGSEKFCRPEDYSHLLEWFKEFYPELFAFKNINQRLNLYSIEYNLSTLLDYPDSVQVKQMIYQTIKTS